MNCPTAKGPDFDFGSSPMLVDLPNGRRVLIAGQKSGVVDTARSYEAVNGGAANSGSLDGPGPVIAGGMLFVNPGYAFIGGMPGNVLLAFAVDGK